MSEPSFPSITLPASADPIRAAVRRMRWFRAAFGTVVQRVGQDIGADIQVDEPALARCFVTWLRRVEQLNPHDPQARRAFFDHAAGLMLRELIAANPCRVMTPPDPGDPQDPARFWPEGFCYTIYCMNVRAAAVQQEYGENAVLAPEFHDLRTWWSFRENVADEGATAVAFFKLFIGAAPDWQMPDSFNPHDPAVLAPAKARPGLS